MISSGTGLRSRANQAPEGPRWRTVRTLLPVVAAVFGAIFLLRPDILVPAVGSFVGGAVIAALAVVLAARTILRREAGESAPDDHGSADTTRPGSSSHRS